MSTRTMLRIAFLGCFTVGFLPTPALAGSIAVLETLVSDNGDGDGFADTRETVTFRLRVQNLVGGPLINVALHLTADPLTPVCISQTTIYIGDMGEGEIIETVDGFEFYVGEIDRTGSGLGPYDDLSFGFEIRATTGNPTWDPGIDPSRLRLDLDLDVAGGSGPTTFLEDFEDGLGAFEVQNLDQGKSSVEGSDGHRCSYHDPDWVNSHVYGSPSASAECYLAASPLHADAVFWGLSGPETSPLLGRGFTGFHSMFFGVDLGPPQNWTTPVAVLEAAAMAQPIHLGWDDVSPTLTIRQQVSLLDERLISSMAGTGESLDRGVVMVQVADDQNDPVGNWLKLDPYKNVYDQQGTDNFFNCMFDPIDDGSTEDSFFDPTDPDRAHGPSSTCWPEYGFANIGQATEPFDIANVGLADGPGLHGMWGIGTWIESRFDLSRFRGRSVRLRFLATALQAVPHETWEDYFLSNGLDDNPVTGDDGWWIDDVEVAGALTSPADVSADVTDNSGLPEPPGGDSDSDGKFDVCDNCAGTSNPGQEDADFDGLGDLCDTCPTDPTNFDPDLDLVCALDDNCPFDANPDQTDGDSDGAGLACDCDDDDANIFPGAEEINDGLDNNCPGDSGYGAIDEITGTTGFFVTGDTTEYSWPEQIGAARYQVARAETPDFNAGCTLIPGLPTSQTMINDAAVPLSGGVFYYIVHSVVPNVGSWGLDSFGAPRVVPCD